MSDNFDRAYYVRVFNGLMQETQSVCREDKSEAAEFKEWVCLYCICMSMMSRDKVYQYQVPGISFSA